MNNRSRRRRVLIAVVAYGLFVAVSYFVRATRSPAINGRNVSLLDRVAMVQAVAGLGLTPGRVRLVYRDYPSGAGQGAATLVLLHGSPGHKEDFAGLAPILAQQMRVVVPDLPGFGASTHSLPDYSFRAH